MSNLSVRTRFAPSPTGYMHVGNLRTALYGYLLAKKHQGQFVLRIEDTDQERYVGGAIDLIYRTLAETGLKHDEGPDVGGHYGPYIQSERKDIYKQEVQKLIENGNAYYCFCDKERLDKLRKSCEADKKTFRYDRHCCEFSEVEIKQQLETKKPYVIRQKMPTAGTTSFDDLVFGTITIDNSELDDQILLKSDGLPTYNFANVLDDHMMKITHIVRGSEYLASTPKYNLLYEAFDWEIPTYVHVSPVMKDAQKKLSKREGDASYSDFIEKGYLKEALINYLALLGWSPGGETEIFSLEELIQAFDVKGINKSPAIFDVNKLNWMNGEYIRKLSLDAFHGYALSYYPETLKDSDANLYKLSAILQARTEKFSDIPENVDFVGQLPDYEQDLFFHKKMKANPENALENLKAMLPVLEELETWDEQQIHNVLFALIETLSVKNGQVLWPLRVVLSGKPVTPGGGIDLALVLGKEESIRRIKKGIDKLDS